MSIGPFDPNDGGWPVYDQDMSDGRASGWDGPAQAILSALPDGVLLVDESGQIVDVNVRAAELFGCSVEDLIGRSVEMLIPRQLRNAHEEHRAGFHEEPQTRSMGAGLELVALRHDGSSFPVDISLSQTEVSGDVVVVASIRDMTEQRQADRELRAAQQRVARLEDRERIARDLHDTVIQEVFGAGLMIQSVIGQIAEPMIADRLEQSVDRLDSSVSRLRSVIFDLNSHRKDDSALGAVQGVIASAVPELGFEPKVRIEGDLGRLTNAHIDHLLPTVREALTNVAKHAFASSVDVQIIVDDESVTLTVNDDGVGAESVASDGMGLKNMTERAVALGGRFQLVPFQGSGTELTWCVPISRKVG